MEINMKNNISSQFKYTLDLGLSATKMAFKLKKTKKDAITHILVLIFIAIMSIIVAFDIVHDKKFRLDLIILIALVVVEIFNLIMPCIIIHIQKKFLKQLNLEEIDYTITEINKGRCTESYYKDNKVKMQNVCSMSKLIGYRKVDNYVFVVFSNFACAIFDINTLNIDWADFEKYILNTILSNRQIKSNRKP